VDWVGCRAWAHHGGGAMNARVTNPGIVKAAGTLFIYLHLLKTRGFLSEPDQILAQCLINDLQKTINQTNKKTKLMVHIEKLIDQFQRTLISGVK
jgi:hypothetical protein